MVPALRSVGFWQEETKPNRGLSGSALDVLATTMTIFKAILCAYAIYAVFTPHLYTFKGACPWVMERWIGLGLSPD